MPMPCGLRGPIAEIPVTAFKILLIESKSRHNLPNSNRSSGNPSKSALFGLRAAGSRICSRRIMDVNYWGEIVVPVGILICFAPALIAAAIMGLKKGDSENEK